MFDESQTTPIQVHQDCERAAEKGIALHLSGRRDLKGYKPINRFILEDPKGTFILIRTEDNQVWRFQLDPKNRGEFNIYLEQTGIDPWYQGELGESRSSITFFGINVKNLIPEQTRKGNKVFEKTTLEGVEPNGTITFPVGKGVILKFDLTESKSPKLLYDLPGEYAK